MYESVAWNWIVLLVGVVAALLVLREVFLWYWKITKMVKLLEEHSQQNRYILECLQSLEKRSDSIVTLLRAQNEQLKVQASSVPASVADKPESSQQG
jgi:Flp pilus assembly protein TadB